LVFAYPDPLALTTTKIAAVSFADIGNLITGIGTLALALGTIAAALIAANSYRIQVTLNRSSALENQGRWLMDLQGQFINDLTFQSIRCHIYEERFGNGQAKSLTRALELKNRLQTASEHTRVEMPQLSDADKQLLVELDGYLNFIGMIKQLVDNGSISFDDAARRFGWYAAEGLNIAAILNEVARNFPDVLAWHNQLAATSEGRFGIRRS
jgi:hypothetical protein